MRALSGALVVSVLLGASVQTAALSAEQPLVELEHVTIFVRDYDEALQWYVERLGFIKIEDQQFGPQQRWVTVAPSRNADTHIVLAVPGETLRGSIGHQHNWVFRTGDCRAAHLSLSARGVRFVAEPQNLPWGCQAIIEDLYGNRIVVRGPLLEAAR